MTRVGREGDLPAEAESPGGRVEDGLGPQVHLGIIGYGFAASSMVPSLRRHPGIRIAAIADPDPSVRNEISRRAGLLTFDNAEELCASAVIDAVYIASPHRHHAHQAIVAARHGKHVLVEKPMALTVEDCIRIRAAAQEHGVQLVVGHTHAFDAPVRLMRKLIERGEIGRVAMVNSWAFSNWIYRPRLPEELDTSAGGGIIYNQVPHQVDMVRLLGGGLVSTVRSSTGVLDSSRPTEGSHATFLEFADGVAATMVYSGYDGFDTDELYGWIGEEGQRRTAVDHGSARRRIAGLTPHDEAELKAKRTNVDRLTEPHGTAVEASAGTSHFGIVVVTGEAGDLRTAPEGVEAFTSKGRRLYPCVDNGLAPDKFAVAEEFYDAIVWDRPSRHDAAWGTATMEVCLAMQDSSRMKREVQLHHQVAVRTTKCQQPEQPGDCR